MSFFSKLVSLKFILHTGCQSHPHITPNWLFFLAYHSAVTPLEILWFSGVACYLSQPGPDTPASLTSPGLALPCSLHPLGSCPSVHLSLGLSQGVTMFGVRVCFLQENYIPSVFASLGIAQHPVLLLFTLLLNKFCWMSQWMNTMYFFPRCSLTDNYGKTWHL